jgi:hypothetical protein
MLCENCHIRPANRRRNLCWTCYSLPGIRERFPPVVKIGGDFYGDPPSPLPTPGLPGSAEKIAAMTDREARHESLFSARDGSRE